MNNDKFERFLSETCAKSQYAWYEGCIYDLNDEKSREAFIRELEKNWQTNLPIQNDNN